MLHEIMGRESSYVYTMRFITINHSINEQLLSGKIQVFMSSKRISKNAEEKAAAPNKQMIGMGDPDASDGQFFIVGLGGSAGGFEAYEEFFKNTPPDTGMGFVLVSHLDPEKTDLLPELIQRYTTMPVTQAKNDLRVMSDHVYIIPPNNYMTIFGGVLKLSEMSNDRGLRMPIDVFLRSLAEDQRENAIAVICFRHGLRRGTWRQGCKGKERHSTGTGPHRSQVR